MRLLFVHMAALKEAYVGLRYEDVGFAFFNEIDLVRTRASDGVRPIRCIVLCSNVGRMATFLNKGRFTISGPVEVFGKGSLVTVFPILNKRAAFFIVALRCFRVFRILTAKGRVRQGWQIRMAST